MTQWVQLTTTGWIGHQILLKLRTQMFDHLQTLSLSFYDKHEVGRVMSRATSDVAAMQELMSTGLMTVLGNLLGLVIVVFILLQQDWLMALVTFAIVPVLVYARCRSGRSGREMHLSRHGRRSRSSIRSSMRTYPASA